MIFSVPSGGVGIPVVPPLSFPLHYRYSFSHRRYIIFAFGTVSLKKPVKKQTTPWGVWVLGAKLYAFISAALERVSGSCPSVNLPTENSHWLKCKTLNVLVTGFFMSRIVIEISKQGISCLVQ
jgi:hypothetical protein